MTSANKKLASGTGVLGHDFAYTYDDIGNRKMATANAQISNYSANSLNQYSQRTVPGVVDVLGAAQADATVTVTFPASGGTIFPTTRQGELYARQLTVDNSTAAQYASVKVTGVKNLVGPSGEDAVTEETRSVLVTGTPEVFTHDADGNLTADAKWTYAWDGENRLKSVETSAAAVTAGVAKARLEFAYDGQGRRVAKKVSNWSPGGWVLASSTLFLFDGWNLLAELRLNPSTSTFDLHSSYVWGTDLSGSLQGAGGVGGLLFSTYSLNLTPYTSAAAYDGNGNVIAYVDLATGNRSATYEYGAFGETLIADGPAAELFPFRFSTKYHDTETGLVYFGFRYKGEYGFINRDPVEENGGINIYGYLQNNPINAIDLLGLVIIYVHGTWSDSANAFPFDFVRTVQSSFDDKNAKFFQWSGDNTDKARRKAALDLAELIRQYKKAHPCEKIRVVAHSHGGNVALLASHELGVHIDELVTLGTPILADYRPDENLGPWENVYSTSDRVQTLPSGAKRSDSSANNIKLSGFGHSELHTVPAWNAAFPTKP